jgi:hypothetical protein
MRRLLAFAVSIVALLVISAAPASAQDPRLRLRATGSGAAVNASPAGQLTGCSGERCFYRYPAGTVVRLTATPTEPGSTLARWLGACTGATTSCTVVMDENHAVTARFSPVTLYADQGTGSGRVQVVPVGQPCGRRCWLYAYGTQVTIGALPSTGWHFSSWVGDCGGRTSSPICSFPMYDDVATAPQFCKRYCETKQPLDRGVKVSISVTGKGYASVNGRKCSSSCTFEFKRGLALALKAVPQGKSFRSWGGSCTGTQKRCQLAAFKDPSGRSPRVTARFG